MSVPYENKNGFDMHGITHLANSSISERALKGRYFCPRKGHTANCNSSITTAVDIA